MAKPIWEKKNPKRSSQTMTASEKASAKKAAKEQGRSSPSLVDNINAEKRSTSSKSKSSKKKKSKSKKKS